MAWIESHQTLGRHIKVRRLARILNIHRAQAIGHLHYLWWWAVDGAPNGDLSLLTDAEIAEVAEWTGDPDHFVAALRECRWLDRDGGLHDWQDYAGRYQAIQERIERQREQTRERVRRHRARQNQPPGDPETPSVTAGKQGAKTANETVTPSNAPTGQDRTRQDITRPDPTGVCVLPSVGGNGGVGNAETHTPETETESARSGKPEARAAELWPTLEEALARADLRGIPRECAEKWWHEHDARGGCDKHGQPLKRWESALSGFATAWRAVESQERARGRPGSSPPQRAPIDWSKGFWGDAKPASP